MARAGDLVLWVIGLALILVAVWVLFTQTPLASWVPVGVVAAIILLIVGIAIMASSDRFGPVVAREDVVVHRGYAPPPYYGPGDRTTETRTEIREDRNRYL